MRFKQLDHDVHDLIMNANRERGMHGWEIAHSLSATVARVYDSIDRLEDAKLIEARWEGGLWPNSDQGIDDEEPSKDGRRRYYRLTSTVRQTLAARLHEQTS